MSGIIIGRADESQATLEAVVRLHRTELNRGFLSSLGDKALSLLFSFAAKSDAAVLLVARNSSTSAIQGFLLGSYGTGRFYKEFLKKKTFQALLHVGPRLLTPQKIWKIAETLLYPSKKEVATLPSSELLDLAVSKNAQGLGVGRALFDEFVSVLRQTGVKEFKITTGESLSDAHAFYERMGARRDKDIEVHSGQVTRVYLYKIK